MFYIQIKKVNNRVPGNFTDHHPSRINKNRGIINVIRSPHIDKKSREQFQQILHKQYFVCKDEFPYQSLIKLLNHEELMFQVRLAVCKTKRFTSTF